MTDDTYALTDAQRCALVYAALNTIAGSRVAQPDLVDALVRITGTDTVLTVRRAYPPPATLPEGIRNGRRQEAQAPPQSRQR
jgi:hypothetical protein